ncbi:uncharacterized protein [Argopecten irradians]|uniref:uncharacterized protein n=1 Tax=Argopecten irradians TaxID=31199 RepID=UPI00371B2845
MSENIEGSPFSYEDQQSKSTTRESEMDEDSLEGDSDPLKRNSFDPQDGNGIPDDNDKIKPAHSESGYDDMYRQSPRYHSDSLDSLSQSNSSTNETSELTALLSSTDTPVTNTGKSRLPVKCATGLTRRSSIPKQKAVKEGKGQKNITRSKTVDLAKGVFNHDDKKKRGNSQSGMTDNHNVRETVASRLRFEKRHLPHEQDCEGDDYMTPTQRKDQLLKDLKIQVKELTSDIEARDSQIERLKLDIDEEARKIIERKNEEAKELCSNLDSLQIEHDDLLKSYQKSLCSIVDLEESVSELNDRIAIQEKRNESIYLEMYKKGQESAQFERNVELERLAVSSDSSSMTMKELIRKLVETESELAKWQSLRRQESYESAEKPETEAEVTLKFLKDTFFHYLTEMKDSDRYLRAMIRIFNYTDVQKKKISTCVTEKQNKSA